MSHDMQKPRFRMMIFVLFLSAMAGLIAVQFSNVEAAQGGNGTADEILVFNRGSKSNPFTVTQAMSGFIMDKPPTGAANANWVSGKYANFAGGTLYFRAKLISIPKNQPGMKLGFCFWQDSRENCKGQKFAGVPGTEATWSFKLGSMWKKNNQSINWANPRGKDGFVVRNAKNKPVSKKANFNWGGENPANWYPMRIHYTVVLVKAGGKFDGWQNYGW